jgi:hypothetical protein
VWYSLMLVESSSRQLNVASINCVSLGELLGSLGNKVPN